MRQQKYSLRATDALPSPLFRFSLRAMVSIPYPPAAFCAAPARHAEIHEQSKGKVGRGRKKDIHIVCSGKVKILYEKSLGKHQEV